MAMQHFPRAALASEVAASIQGRTLLGDGPNGVFLAAPRRTGKSTFLQLDLQPELERQGVLVIYVDLWADQRRDPGDLIAEAIGRSIERELGVIERAAKRAGLESVTVGGLKVNTARIGKPDGQTLTDALAFLAEKSGRPVALLIDEAQHALTSEAGENAMAALKAARDTLNRPGDVKLMLVMSGSDRDKLLRLVNTTGAPFYGSQVSRMPPLGPDFVAFVADLIERQQPTLAPIDIPALAEAFKLFGSRPQFFAAALAEALSPLSGVSERFENLLLAAARRRLAEDEAQMESEYLGLRPLEQAVVWRLLEQGTRFRPYDAEALRFYRDRIAASGEEGKVTAQDVQKAIDSIRARSPSLIWKSARGEYALDDVMMHGWYAARVAAGAWPPVANPNQAAEDLSAPPAAG